MQLTFLGLPGLQEPDADPSWSPLWFSISCHPLWFKSWRGCFQDWLGLLWEHQEVPESPTCLRSISSDGSSNWSINWIERPRFPRWGCWPFPHLSYPSLPVCSSPAGKINTSPATPAWEWGWMGYGNHCQCIMSKLWHFTVLEEPATEVRAPGFLK